MSDTPPDVLWLDGMPDEAVPLPADGRRTALAHDPFEEEPAADPFALRLESLRPAPAPVAEPEARRPASAPIAEPEARRPASAPIAEPEARPPVAEPEARRPEPPRPAPGLGRTWLRTPRVAEVELPDRAGLAERLLDDDVRRRLAALTHLPEGGAPFDRYGFSPAAAQQAFPVFHWIYRYYFRVRSEGHEHVPEEGPVVLAANHGGLLPFDGAMTVVDLLLHTDPPRLARAVVDRWAGTLPWVNVFYARVGQVIGTRENVRDLLEDGQLVLVFPEGMEGVRKRITQRYRLQGFRKGFVEAALRARAPIVPCAVVGSDDQAPILHDLGPVARRLGLPFFPVTPTFPWLGPLGLVPYPVGYRIVYGEPLPFHEQFGPDDARDPRLVRYLADRVRREVQHLLDRHR